jgi:glycosyltransferase involved in cell wall biosynthesis
MKLAHRLNIGKRYLVFSHRHQTKKTAKDIATIGDPVLAVSEDVAKGYRDAGVKELGIMYGLPNTEAFAPPRQPVKNDKTRFILLGRLPNPAKGLDTALDAWSMLDADLRARCELHLVSFIEPTDLQVEGVVVHRWTPQWEIPELLRTMDVMLAVSNNETFSQAIVQGMLTGLPIIATPLPVYTEKMDTGGGIVCDSSEKVAKAMTDLAQDPDRRASMGSIGRQTALDRYVWETDVFIRRYLFPVGTFGADE